MKNLLVAGAVMAGFATAPALAADSYAGFPGGAQGFVGVGGAFGSTDAFGSPVSASIAAVGGAMNVPLPGGLNIEFEGAGAQLTVASGGPSGAVPYSRGQIHVYLRNPAYAIGGYGGFESLFTFVSLWNVGVEAQAYMGSMTWGGQVAWSNWTSGTTGTSIMARGSLEMFLTDNIAVHGDARWHSTSVASGSTFTFGAGAEARVAGTPWSLFGDVRWTSLSSLGPSGSTTTGLVGVRAHSGNGTLFQAHRTGVAFNTIPLF